MLSSAFYGLAHVVTILLNLATLIIVISIGLSWFNIDPYNQFVRAIQTMSEFMYKPFRPLTRMIPGPFDFAPFCAMLVIVFLQKAIPVYLMGLHYQQMK